MVTASCQYLSVFLAEKKPFRLSERLAPATSVESLGKLAVTILVPPYPVVHVLLGIEVLGL